MSDDKRKTYPYNIFPETMDPQIFNDISGVDLNVNMEDFANNLDFELYLSEFNDEYEIKFDDDGLICGVDLQVNECENVIDVICNESDTELEEGVSDHSKKSSQESNEDVKDLSTSILNEGSDLKGERSTDQREVMQGDMVYIHDGNALDQIKEKIMDGTQDDNNRKPNTDCHSTVSTQVNHAIDVKQTWSPPSYSPTIDLPFDPDIFQQQSFYFLSQGQSVLVTAHTSSGKTTIVDYALLLARLHKTKIMYTSPIKALSNQKYFEFKKSFMNELKDEQTDANNCLADEMENLNIFSQFRGDKSTNKTLESGNSSKKAPGIITGDVTINKESNFLILTTEILRSLLYNRDALLNDLEYVVFDEVHYINNQERGVVWEECIIMLPHHVKLILLSACIPNALDFAKWVGRIRKTPIYVISTEKRAVPLEYFLCENGDLKLIHSESGNLKLGSKCNKKKEENLKHEKIQVKKKITVPVRKKDNLDFTVKHILSVKLVPSIFFCFSKKKCHDLAFKILRPLLTPAENQKVVEIISEKLNSKLSQKDQTLPQIEDMRTLLVNGIGIHHSGLLPILKEIVEILFSMQLVKILFATETFSMGVNFPAKSVVFMSLKKRDNECLRLITPGEFMQMSGRAGRRNLDKRGVVIVNHFNDNEHKNLESTVRNLIKSSTFLISRFKTTWNMILQMFRNNLKVEDVLKNSFCEENVQKNIYKDVNNLMLLEKYYENSLKGQNKEKDNIYYVPIVDCKFCIDLKSYIKKLKSFYFLNNKLIKTYLSNKKIKDNLVVVFKDLSVAPLEFCFIKNNMNDQTCVKNNVEKIIENVAKTFVDHPHTFTNKDKTNENLGVENILLLKIKDNSFMEYFDNSNCTIKQEVEMKNVVDLYKDLNKAECLKCPFIDFHYTEELKKVIIETKINELKQKMDNNNLILFKDYFTKVNFLKALDFIDENQKVTLKGRVACEIKTVDPVFMTELLMNNGFADFDHAEIMAFACGFLLNERDENEYFKAEIREKFESKINEILHGIVSKARRNSPDKYDQVNTETDNNKNILIDFKFDSKNFITKEYCVFEFYTGYIIPVLDWCKGCSLSEIVNKYNIGEGVLIRAILRLDEFCREIRNVVVLINDLEFGEKIENAVKMLKRDILHYGSLYLDDDNVQ